jgi:acyl-CoA thioester hydrolase
MELRVRFAETDQMRIAHHSAYVVWFEAARVEWLRERGLRYRDLEDEGVSLAVQRIEIQYREAARFDDRMRVTTRLSGVKSRRVRFSYVLERLDEAGEPQALLAMATTEHTPTGSDGRALRLPDSWRSALERWADVAPPEG